jgi:hypothetical protein
MRSSVSAIFDQASNTDSSGELNPRPSQDALVDLLVRRQELDHPVQQAALLEHAHHPLMHRQQPAALRPAVGQQHVLPVVVGQHEVRDILGHRREQFVALLDSQIPVLHDPVEQDLDVDLVVAGVDARGVVDGVGVQPNAVLRGLDAPELGQPEVAALAHDLAAQL